jgi:hypothetical protein
MLTLASDIEELMPVVAVTGGCLIAVVWIIMATIDSTVKAKAREATRRELAAYVAEGSMTSADAAAIMNAGKSKANAQNEFDKA